MLRFLLMVYVGSLSACMPDLVYKKACGIALTTPEALLYERYRHTALLRGRSFYAALWGNRLQVDTTIAPDDVFYMITDTDVTSSNSSESGTQQLARWRWLNDMLEHFQGRAWQTYQYHIHQLLIAYRSFINKPEAVREWESPLMNAISSLESYLSTDNYAPDILGHIPSDMIPCVTTIEFDGVELNRGFPENFPYAITQFCNLTALDLGANRLPYIPPVVFQLMGLTKLYLNANKLVQVDGIQELKNLQILHLSENCFTHIPPGLYYLPCLQTLFIDDNPLSLDVPAQGNCFPSLRVLAIGNENMEDDYMYPPLREMNFEQLARFPALKSVIVLGDKPPEYCPEFYQTGDNRVFRWRDSSSGENGYDVEPALF